jgi:hypothetical protein
VRCNRWSRRSGTGKAVLNPAYRIHSESIFELQLDRLLCDKRKRIETDTFRDLPFFSCSSLSFFFRLATPKQRGGKPTDIQDEGVQITESHPNPQIKSHSESQSQSHSQSQSQVRRNGKHQTLHTLEPAHENSAFTEENSGGKDKDKEKEKEKEAEEMIVDEIEEFNRDPTPTPRPASTPKGRGEREVTPQPAGKAAGGSQLRSQLQSESQSQSQSQARSQARNKTANHDNNDDTTTTIVAPVPTKISSQAAQVPVPALASQLRPTRTRRERVAAARSFVDMGTLY